MSDSNVVDYIFLDYDKCASFTGHRPKKLKSYDYRHPENLKIIHKLKAIIVRMVKKLGVKVFITGMALGIDTWAARIVLSLKEKYPDIKLVCAIPCKNQYDKWSEEDTEIYHDILKQADHVYYVSREPYTQWCMNDRNKWMVDNSKYQIAVWNGDTSGGTYNAVKYAKTRQRSVIQLNPNNFEVKIY